MGEWGGQEGGGGFRGELLGLGKLGGGGFGGAMGGLDGWYGLYVWMGLWWVYFFMLFFYFLFYNILLLLLNNKYTYIDLNHK